MTFRFSKTALGVSTGILLFLTVNGVPAPHSIASVAKTATIARVATGSSIKTSPINTQKTIPTPLATPVATPVAAQATPVAAQVTPKVISLRNRLIGPGFNVAVSTYSDCSGNTILTRTAAVVDSCVWWDTYFMGHHPGVFSTLYYAHNGEILTWYDPQGTTHNYRIMGHWDGPGGTAADAPPGTAAQFQTCINPDGSTMRVFYAIAV